MWTLCWLCTANAISRQRRHGHQGAVSSIHLANFKRSLHSRIAFDLKRLFSHRDCTSLQTVILSMLRSANHFVNVQRAAAVFWIQWIRFTNSIPHSPALIGRQSVSSCFVLNWAVSNHQILIRIHYNGELRSRAEFESPIIGMLLLTAHQKKNQNKQF